MISIAICTWNRAGQLKALLEDLVRECQEQPEPVEVLVIDNNCTDTTPEVIAGFFGRLPIRHVRETTQGLSRSRNRAFAEAAGDVLIFADDDVRLRPGWLTGYRRAFSDPRVMAAGGRVVPVWPENIPRWAAGSGTPPFSTIVPFYEHGDEPQDITDPDAVPPAANVAMRMSVVRSLGGFREDMGMIGPILRGGEDSEFLNRVIRISGSIRYLPDAAVEHPIEPRRLSLWFNLRYLYGGGVGQAVYEPPTRDTPLIFGVPRWSVGRLVRGSARAGMRVIRGDLRGAAIAAGTVATTIGYIHTLLRRKRT